LKNWLVPVLRHLISGVVAVFAAWTLGRFGVEVTTEQREFLTGTLTTFGAALIGFLWVGVSKMMKPRFLRKWHPAGSQNPTDYTV
jgi:phosphatidylserine synthase